MVGEIYFFSACKAVIDELKYSISKEDQYKTIQVNVEDLLLFNREPIDRIMALIGGVSN